MAAPKKVIEEIKTYTWDHTREYVFELLGDHSEYQPKDKASQNPLSNGHQPVLTMANEGMAFNVETGQVEKWRLISGQPSIWVNKQQGLEKATPLEINRMLSEPQNEITFVKGFLRVRGVDERKLDALVAMDEFDDNDHQYLSKNRVFRMLDPQKEIDKKKIDQNSEFYALKKAMESTDEQCLAFALALGIDINDQSEHGMKKIRSEFYDKAKANPTYFNKMFDNPKNKVRFVVSEALRQNIIGITDTAIIFTEGKVPMMTINPSDTLSPLGQFCDKVFKKDKKYVEYYTALQTAMGMASE